MIYYIGVVSAGPEASAQLFLPGMATDSSFEMAQWDDFKQWMDPLREVEHDIETTVTPWWCDKVIRTVQFGNQHNQWVLQWSQLSEEQRLYIKQKLEDRRVLKIIHNAMFECVVWLFHGVRVQEVCDTMLMEKVLYGGEQEAYNLDYDLAGILMRRYKIWMDKTYQTAFNEDLITAGHIRYAADDVKHLSILKQDIYWELQQHELEWTMALENEVVLAFAEMTYTGMELDKEHWLKLLDEAQPLVGESEEKLYDWIRSETKMLQKAYELGFIHNEDQIMINWRSHKQIRQIFAYVLPDCPGTTKAVVKTYVKEVAGKRGTVPKWLLDYSEGNTEGITQYLLYAHKEWLIQNELLIPAGTFTMNWNSVQQALPLLQQIEPKLKDLSEESRGRCSHPALLDYEEFKDTLKLTTSYGEKFLAHIEPDGKIRTRFNQILTTGRVASSGPNMQQIPAKEKVGNKYRNAFLPPAGWRFVSSDYISQELIVIAFLSQDAVWLNALSKGQDLHSICAELVFKQKWRDAAQPDCAYYKMVIGEDGKLVHARAKCKCKKHGYLRTGIKTINFGLAYGMSEFKLAGTLRISVPEAKQLIQDYFRAFPRIKVLLDFLGQFGLRNGYIQTIYPYYRKRYFPNWRLYDYFIEAHIQGAQYHPGLGEIERASKNMPIQGTSADMMKTALVLIYWEIHEQQLEDKVRLAMQVHDQADSYAREDYAEIWAKRQTELMNEAAKFIIPSGILKTDTTITERWQK